MVMVYGKWVLIVTKDKNVYILDHNKDDHSNIGDTNIGLYPKKMKELCGKNIKTFACNSYYVLALTEEGEVYSWGFNKKRKSDNGSHIPVILSTPTRVISLSEKCIVDIACGSRHSLALTNDGKVYSWRENYGHVGNESTNIFGDNLPWMMKPEFEGKKIVSIACGSMFNMVITDEGKLYGWGDNESGQIAVDPISHFAASDHSPFSPLGLYSYDPSEKKHYLCFREITVTDGKAIVKVTCGFEHTLALTDEGKLYAWGKNDNGQVGVNERTSFDPIMVNLPEKVIDIAAYGNLSIAIGSNETVYVWGDCFGQNITTPIPTGFCKIYEALVHSKSYYIMQKPLTVTITENYVEELLNILKSLEAAFDDLLTSDFTVQVEGKFIHVHRAILNIRCQHFRKMIQHDCIENGNENLPSPPIHIVSDKFSYIVYKAFLKYLYTGIVVLPSDKVLELMKLAGEYCETNLKKECGRILEQEVTASNVAFFYKKAIECNAKEFEEFCFQFALCHMKDVVLSKEYIKLDMTIKDNFIHRAAEENAFRT
ncbi:rcc1 and btb domain-containing protein 1 [Lasius niger]|uniref:Rcc1 and btb domain-containing protein 1 n=1 Tax=Lasius niger TaxID=67767 RepID=A0A0J7KHV7_LASNI|nr:rcc1 and btb domain-containing protein 1 [Lasius niger]